MMMYLLFLLGFVMLIKGADVFVDGSVGVAALIRPSEADKDILGRDIFVMLACSVAVPYYLLNFKISRYEGAILIVCLIFYLWFLVHGQIQRSQKEQKKKVPLNKQFLFKNTFIMILGLGVVVIASDLVVDNAVKIARYWGLSETFIGLTIISIGTSLPELITSVSASRKGDSGLALGNAIGSNIFNILFILGLSAVIRTIHVTQEAFIDSLVMVGMTALFAAFCIKNKGIQRKHAVLFIVVYGVYMVYVAVR